MNAAYIIEAINALRDADKGLMRCEDYTYAERMRIADKCLKAAYLLQGAMDTVKVEVSA